MATNKSTSRIRRPRNPTEPPSALANATPLPSAAAWQALREVIEAERRRLMTAEAVLHCVEVAMQEDERDHPDGPHYPTLVEFARETIKGSIDGLDSVRLKAALEQAGVQRANEVKESAVEYAVH